MNDYVKRISLKTIWLSILRRWKIILAIFFSVAIISVVVTQFMLTKKYSSSFTFLNKSGDLANANYVTVVSLIRKEETINSTVESLKNSEKPIYLTTDQILDGISIPSWTKNTPYVTVYFSSSNKEVVKPVLTELSKSALESVKASFPNMVIYSQPTNPTKSSKDTTYLLIGLAAGLVFSLGFAFIDEIISDEVYDKQDVKYLGSPAFEITASK